MEVTCSWLQGRQVPSGIAQGPVMAAFTQEEMRKPRLKGK